MKNINVFGYATFGTPNGFTQSCIQGNQSLEKVLKTFDFKADAIQLLSPNDRIYSIRKENIQKDVVLSYSVYTFAKEKSSNRSGTFIGTSLIFTNVTLPENLILSNLHEIHSNLKNNNVKANVLTVNHSKDFNLQNVFPKDFEKLEFQTKNISFKTSQNNGNNLVIFTDKFEDNIIQNLFKNSLELLQKYETIYFIDSNEIAEFVGQKRLFKLINADNLDQEIQKMQEEQNKKIETRISELINEKLKLEEERKRTELILAKQIQQNEQNHTENSKKISELKSNFSNFNTFYQNYSRKFDDHINSLRTNKNLDEVNNSFKTEKRTFEKEKGNFENLIQVSPFSAKRTDVNPQMSNQNTSRKSNNWSDGKSENKKINPITAVSLILNGLLIIGGLIYFFWYAQKNSPKTEIDSTISENIVVQDSLSFESKLNPFPNDSITVENRKEVALKLKDSVSTLKETAKVIFEKNPKSVGNSYQYQFEDYKKLLFDKNKNAFSIKNLDTILMKKDSLKTIPSLKINP